MTRSYFYIIIIAISLAACNNSNTTPDTKEENHSAHGMKADATGYCDSVNNGLINEDTLKGSPFRTAMNTIGKTHVHMEYSSPGVKGRTIWGGLVAYGKVWVAGAHAATSVRFYKAVTVGKTKVPAGTYAFFVIPGRDEWTLILNSRFDQHLTDEYDEKEDIVRVKAIPQKQTFMPRLTYLVTEGENKSGNIQFNWENLQIEMPFKVQ